jgi:hypothetical protein
MPPYPYVRVASATDTSDLAARARPSTLVVWLIAPDGGEVEHDGFKDSQHSGGSAACAFLRR